MAARRVFGTTWWGKAWIDALQRRARLDENRLPRGRTYARHDRVREIELSPGEVNARVQGSRGAPYAVRVHIRRFSDSEWNVVLDAITAKAAHTAALLDGELDPGIVDDARAVGVELLPTAGEVVPRCSCPDRAVPCKHAAAVCYLVADELDADPFALLRLRGRSREEVLAELRRRRAAGSSRPADRVRVPGPAAADPGLRAVEAWARVVARPPRPPNPRSEPGRPVPFPLEPPPGAPFSGDGLRALATDAAERAWRMTRGEGRSGLVTDGEEGQPQPAAQAQLPRLHLSESDS